MSNKPPVSVQTPKSTQSKAPATPASTPAAQKKRELTSPDFPGEQKKNKPYLSPELPMSNTTSDTEEVSEMDVVTDNAVGSASETGDTGHQSNLNITLRQADIVQISSVLKESFREELRSELSEMIKSIVDGVISGLNEKINTIERENSALKQENTSLKSRIEKLESAAEAAEQYSRRNCLRVSGIPEVENEVTDDIILKMASDIKVDIALDEIDRSHRIGRPVSTKPRDIIIKLSTFRVRQKLYKARKELKTQGYVGVFINEDLTRLRSGLLFKGRQLVKEKRIIGAWSSNCTVLVKDNGGAVHRIMSCQDLARFEAAPLRPR